MEYELNQTNQPVGPVVRDWEFPPHPGHETMEGCFCRLEPLDARHTKSLYDANSLDVEGRNWTYLPYGPFDTLSDFRAWIEQHCGGSDPQFYAIVDLKKGAAVGVASYLRVNPSSGSIEVGHINYSPLLQRTPAATEAMYLMMARAFDLGYRRYEWKCNALNIPSRIAAQRLGFSFEGVFRQATVVKGRNRDTAWYAAINCEWPALKEAFRQWLSPSNFDEQGKQGTRLSALTAPILNQRIVDTGS
jgi:RimJ/RimL family protein N-acetyltransferase